MKAKLLVVCIMVIAGLMLAQTALAKETPQKVTISGAGLLSEIVFTGDQEKLNALAMMRLEDYDSRSTTAPEGISGEGYLITRYMQESPNRLIAFDQVRYFEDPAGGRGYIHFIGLVNGSSEYDNRWFRANREGEAVLQALISSGQAESQAVTSAIAKIFLNAMVAFFP